MIGRVSDSGANEIPIFELGLAIVPGEHPIAPVMLGDAALAARFAERLLERGVYVIGFSYPVVPMGKARSQAPVPASPAALHPRSTEKSSA